MESVGFVYPPQYRSFWFEQRSEYTTKKTKVKIKRYFFHNKKIANRVQMKVIKVKIINTSLSIRAVHLHFIYTLLFLPLYNITSIWQPFFQ
jgi:hypothetical protein